MEGYDWNYQDYSCFILKYKTCDGEKVKEFYRHKCQAIEDFNNADNPTIINFSYCPRGYHHGFGKRLKQTNGFLEDCKRQKKADETWRQEQEKIRKKRMAKRNPNLFNDYL